MAEVLGASFDNAKIYSDKERGVLKKRNIWKQLGCNSMQLNIQNINFDLLLIVIMLGFSSVILLFYTRILL